MTNSNDHSVYRILLYYCYVPIPDVNELVEFHEQLNKQQQHQEQPPLGGRVRVSSEGLNGVLSGLLVDLQSYETQLREKLVEMNSNTTGSSSSSSSSFELDMKYCELRRDLAVVPQLFTELLVQKTSQVVSLVEMESYHKRASSARKNNHARKTPSSVNIESEYRTLQEIYHKSLLDTASTAQHLSPAEWNETFEKVTHETTNKVVLLDCRNSYESAVGYFCSPNASTILTNTRKFSELPMVLLHQVQNQDNDDDNDSNNNAADAAATVLSEADHIFMYCTGGVRCERASGFLKTLLQEKKKQSSSSLPQLYQLHGGIQRYLEHDDHHLYRGKNFVFDPRRTDPNHGGTDSIVGRCLVCDTPHDDYDNGHAPAENFEARCCKCRILILVCNTCRQHVTCWGEESPSSSSSTTNDYDAKEEIKPKLYCGGRECLHMPPVRVIRS
jgi:predicted sulfurtransferase